MSDAALATLAEHAGLLVEWRDNEGRTHKVAPDTLRAALAAMGLSVDGDLADAERHLAETAASPHFVTGDVGHRIALDIDGPARLRREDGESTDVDPRHLVVDTPGYHRLETRDGEMMLAIAPRHAPSVGALTHRPRAWGSAVQLYALRRPDRAFGDFGALADFAAALATAGGDALAVSPAHALFAAEPTRYSPYSPSSRDFLNILYADCGGSEDGGGDLIDWTNEAPARLARLRAAFERFDGDPAFDAFVATGGDALRGHALFEAIDAAAHGAGHGSGWQAWPEQFRDPAADAVAAFAADNAQEVRFHLWLQWLADAGLARAHRAARDGGMRIGLISDLAVGLDPGGSHAWARRDELIAGLSIGAPPDYFQPKGQGWGITGFSPVALARLGFEPYLRTLRAALAHAGGVRIDHALGLGRLWVIPDGAEPLDGVYMRYPIDDMLRLLALEASRADALVIGEDLGVVPDGFRDRLADRHLLGMAILPFERDHDGGFADPRHYRRTAAAMTSTHDLSPIAGWWDGVDLDWRERLDNEVETRADRAKDRDRLGDRAAALDLPRPHDAATAADAAIGLVATSACELAIVPAEDLFGLAEAPNIPGTTTEHPNWRRRYPTDAATAFADPAVARRTALIAEERP